MLQQIDWNDTPDSDVVPTNLYYLTVADLKWEYTNDGKLNLATQMKVEAPEMWKGATIFPRFFIGTDDDPGADQPETWKKRGAQDLKKFLVGVFGEVAALTGDIAADVEATRGAGVLCLINAETDNRQTVKDKDTGAQVPNPYLGREQNRYKKWFPPSDPEAYARVGLMETPSAGGKAKPSAPAAPRPPAAPPPPAAPAAAPAPPPAPSVPRTVPARPGGPAAAPARPAPPPPPPPRPQA